MSTSTLTTNINTITGTFSDYLTVVLTTWFPWIVGITVVIVVLGLVLYYIRKAFVR